MGDFITTIRFWKVFAIIDIIVNVISIFILQLDHWIGFFRDGILCVMQFFWFIMSVIMPSEPIMWNFLWTGISLIISILSTHIIAFVITVVIFMIGEYRESKDYKYD